MAENGDAWPPPTPQPTGPSVVKFASVAALDAYLAKATLPDDVAVWLDDEQRFA